MEIYDALVVGAGTAGCLTAKTIAASGLTVCIIEKKKRDEIGEKVCGDALAEEQLSFIGLEKPNSGEFESRIDGVKIYSPDEKTVFTIADKDFIGYVLNRRLFGQWLLKKAIDKGAILKDNMNFREPIIEKGAVAGILARDMKTGQNVSFKSKVVVDASGFLGVVRHRLPVEMGIDREIESEDVSACYREIRQLKQRNQESRYCEIYLNQFVSPGGYVWIFPKGDAKVNVGIGVCMRGKYPNPKKQLYANTFAKPLFDGSSVLKAGSWFDPTRRPFDNMVSDGVVLVGDAASLVNPVHGGGIMPSMLSGYFAGQTIVEALGKGEPTKEALWSYNKKFVEAYGKKQASSEVFRLFLHSSSDEELNYGMSEKIVTEEDVLRVGMGDDFHLSAFETARRIFRGMRHIRILTKLRFTVTMMHQISTHYKTYPDSSIDFEPWRLETLRLMALARKKLLNE